MTEWDRNSQWRQGLVIPADSITAIGLTHANIEAPTIAVLVSHDCDITQAPEVEGPVLILGSGAVSLRFITM